MIIVGEELICGARGACCLQDNGHHFSSIMSSSQLISNDNRSSSPDPLAPGAMDLEEAWTGFDGNIADGEVADGASATAEAVPSVSGSTSPSDSSDVEVPLARDDNSGGSDQLS